MSNLKVNTINDASGGSNAVLYGVSMRDGGTGWVNRIINGDMRIDQRNAGASVTPTNSQYLLDRWQATLTQSSKYTVQQNAGSVTPPTGFTNYLGVTSSSAYSITSGDAFRISQQIEGFNIADFAWGTANAQSITVSFWVRSSLTGAFGAQILNNAGNRAYPFSYTINTANTWEQKSITIPGDTSGTWLTNNGSGMFLGFGLGYGSSLSGTANVWNAGTAVMPTGAVSVVGTNGATFYITGVQLEAGSVASPFERIDYGRQLMMCQRYYYRVGPGPSAARVGAGYNTSTTVADYILFFPVEMRVAATSLEQSGTAADYNIAHGSTNTNCSSVPTLQTGCVRTGGFRFTVASGLTAGDGSQGRLNTSGYLGWSAEL